MGLASCVTILLLVLMGLLLKKAFSARHKRGRTESALRRLEHARIELEEISAPAPYPEEIYAEPIRGPVQSSRLGQPRRLDMDVPPSPGSSLPLTSNLSTVRVAQVTVEPREEDSSGPSPLLSFSPPVSISNHLHPS